MARAVFENAHRLETGITEAVWRRSTRCELAGHRSLNGKRYALSRGASLEGKFILPSGEPGCFCSSTPIIKDPNEIAKF